MRRYFETWAERQVWTDGTYKAMSLALRSAPFAELELLAVRPTHVETRVKSMLVRGGRAGVPLPRRRKREA